MRVSLAGRALRGARVLDLVEMATCAGGDESRDVLVRAVPWDSHIGASSRIAVPRVRAIPSSGAASRASSKNIS